MLTVQDLSFGYPRRPHVLSDVELCVPEGLTIVLGPNGAGKSTLFHLLAGLLEPSAGRMALHGQPLDAARCRSAVALMPQRSVAVPGLSVQEQVALHGWTKGLSRREAWLAARRALADVSLSDVARQRASTLSGGQLARVGLAQALVHQAEVLILDEPLAALDPLQRETFQDLVAVLAGERIVLLSTHDVHDIGPRYDRVTVLAGGRVRFAGAVSDFLGDRSGQPLSPLAAYRRVVGP